VARNVLHQVYVDSSPKGELRWFDRATNEIGRHRIRKGRGVHETEFLAVMNALEDVLPRLGGKETVELYCDRQVVVNQLNHKAGINEKAILKIADKVWNLALQAKKEKEIEVKFLWVSRKENPAGKMLGT
jgi:ribonuclease HI